MHLNANKTYLGRDEVELILSLKWLNEIQAKLAYVYIHVYNAKFKFIVLGRLFMVQSTVLVLSKLKK